MQGYTLHASRMPKMTEGILNKPRDIRRSGHPLEPWRRTPPESMSGGRPDASVGLENILGIDFGQCLLSLIVLYIGLIIGKVLATVEIDTYYLNGDGFCDIKLTRGTMFV